MNLPPQEFVQKLASHLSQEGLIAFRTLLEIHLRAAQILGYMPTTNDMSRRVRKEVGAVSAQDLLFVLSNCPPGLHLLPFFEAERRYRAGEVLNWVYRGMQINHTPDILFISETRDGQHG